MGFFFTLLLIEKKIVILGWWVDIEDIVVELIQ